MDNHDEGRAVPAPRRAPTQRLTRAHVVDTALTILAGVGLPDLTMRAIGTELGVQQSALYHHFENKQALLGAVADEIIARGPRTVSPPGGWQDQARQQCCDVRDAVTAYPDGADLVMSMWAFGMGGHAPFVGLCDLLVEAGLTHKVAPTAARTLLHFVYGHAYDEQSHDHAARSGITFGERAPTDFDTGVNIVLAGINALL
ncbi:TetR/AcrR family transcriptional regulator C-terminal domain-containing protein [Janibacter cremeus]|uniref:AcrR family transcriptional regulator n=1 Tax=Janibacter cremeus TaxID=1285192 RepID=A0A852VS70_9MICO|nr:TetR/AcrR family transcriptional regulator C-terminal domain-containing protein [Janibacter cremeus]NYF98728.1 AcrR family transcriptional regulator [Janibacter cremeus]